MHDWYFDYINITQRNSSGIQSLHIAPARSAINKETRGAGRSIIGGGGQYSYIRVLHN